MKKKTPTRFYIIGLPNLGPASAGFFLCLVLGLALVCVVIGSGSALLLKRK